MGGLSSKKVRTGKKTAHNVDTSTGILTLENNINNVLWWFFFYLKQNLKTVTPQKTAGKENAGVSPSADTSNKLRKNDQNPPFGDSGTRSDT